jgi:hypothetical protein
MEHRWQPRCPAPAGLTLPVSLDARLDGQQIRGPTRGQARSQAWRRTSRGFYVPAGVERTVEQRILEQWFRVASGRRPGECVVTGWAALRLHGAAFFDGLGTDGQTEREVLLLGPGSITPGRGARLGRTPIPKDQWGWRFGMAVADPERALADELGVLDDLRDRVPAVDMALAAELTSLRRLRAWSQAARPRHRERLWAALGLASEGSRSPQETRMRLTWVLDARLPTPLCNQPIYDSAGRLLGVPDLLEPVAGVVGEYDGAEHRSSARHRRDVDREARFRAAGLEYFAAVGSDIRDHDRLADRMWATYQRARQHPRRWTLTSQHSRELTLDERLTVRDAVRQTSDQQ